jgi:folate-binding protein YgfZ
MLTNFLSFNLNQTYGVLEVSGEDAATFLQGQLTNDIHQVTNQHAIYSGFCNPKGRLIGFFIIIKFNESYLLILPRSILENIHKKLSMYILRSKVKLTMQDEAIQIYGLLDKNKNSNNEALPKNHLDVLNSNECHIIKLQGVGRFMLVGLKDACQALIHENPELLVNQDINLWKQEEILSGSPNIYPATQEAFIPQSLNLDLIDAINFKKGCYTGQEIVARTHYLGKPKRRMFIAKAQAELNSSIGDPIDFNGQAIGHIVDLVIHEGKTDLLIELHLDHTDKGLTIDGHSIELKHPSF